MLDRYSSRPGEGKDRAKIPEGPDMQILVVEDDDSIAEPLLDGLHREGFTTTRAATGAEALAADPHDLILLDLGLPDIDGKDVCRRIRDRSDVPIIVVTARGDEIDRVVLLELGADDYVVKPFSPRELVARVRACLRRRNPAAPPRWQASGAFEIDREGRRVRYRGRLLELTRYEYGVLAALLERPGAVLSRAQLMDRVWTDALDSSDRTVDTHVKTLRAKLRDAGGGAGDPITTHRGLGYSLDGGD